VGGVAPASAATGVSVVTASLDSPRGVALSHGDVLVAEAGHGGDICIPNAIFGTNCIGLNSQISVVEAGSGEHHPLISHLFSSLLRSAETLVVSGIATRGDSVLAILGEYPQQFASINCTGMPADCAEVKAAALAQAGQLISVNGDGHLKALGSVGGFDFDFTAEIPDQEHDSNPYGVLPSGDGDALVADAGSNSLNLVSDDGISVVHYFHFAPPAGTFPSDAVPTCVVRAGGKLWVADLSGRLFRIQGGAATQVTVADSGGTGLLHHVTNCTSVAAREEGDADSSDSSGATIFLVNMWTTPGFPSPNTGSVVRFDVATGQASVVASKLNFPNGIAAVSTHTLYVSANSICPASGGPPAECGFMGHTSGLLLKITD